MMYDSTYCVDKHSRVENNFLTVAYKEHPQKVSAPSKGACTHIDAQRRIVEIVCIDMLALK